MAEMCFTYSGMPGREHKGEEANKKREKWLDSEYMIKA
jgi:hypothetical protein